jgi:UDP-glucose 4-epimerase
VTVSLVTGGCGFIGSHLVARLLARGDDVRVIDNMRRGSADALSSRVAAGVLIFEADIRDREALDAAATEADRIYHLAAQSNVMGALIDREYSFTANAAGTFNVLDCATRLGIPRVVFASSREVYGEACHLPVAETHPLQAKNLYGASKVAGEAYCRTFAHCYGLDVQVVRLANVYGAGDRDRVIPLFLAAAAAGDDLRLYGGEQVLDFVWIETVIDALVAAGEGAIDGPTNIGSGAGISIAQLAERIVDVTGSSSRIVREPARDAEVSRFVADVTKMRALGIEPDADSLTHLSEMAGASLAVAAR